MLQRFAVGLCLAQAIFHGLRLLVVSVLALMGQSPDWWQSLAGVIVLQFLQAASVFIGAFPIAGGRRGGTAIGAGLGLLNAIALFGFDLLAGNPLSAATLPALLASQVFVGAFAGAVGARIWKPFPDPLVPIGPDPLEVRSAQDTVLLAWGRIGLGAVLIVIGTVFASELFDRLLRTGSGVLHVGTRAQAEFITWEIAALSTVLGGVVAGSLTRSGLIHGFLTGFLAGCALTALSMIGNLDEFSAHSFVLREFGRDPDEMAAREIILYVGGHAILLASVGGWLGSKLFPIPEPVHARDRSGSPF